MIGRWIFRFFGAADLTLLMPLLNILKFGHLCLGGSGKSFEICKSLKVGSMT